MNTKIKNIKPQGLGDIVMVDKGQSLANFVVAQEPEQRVACIEFRDRSGNIIKASDIFPMESQFNKTIFAPAGGGIRSLK